ncbi:glutamine--fructose-6-phosphate transaminase (isomerizing) [Spirochaeta dissipatitropha]
MCGIVGYCGPKVASDVILDGLKRLEYRGYDSAGLCTGSDGVLNIIKTKGKIADLRAVVPDNMPGTWGIGHTRWATHGEVNDVNAHPHADTDNKIAVVHNGIVENYAPLRARLQEQGIVFRSETDSEVISHLVSSFYDGDLEAAVKRALSLLQGTYGILVMHSDQPGLIVGARNGSPLVLGIGDNELFLASDVTAIVGYTRQVVYLDDGEVVVVHPEGFRTTDLRNKTLSKTVDTVNWDLDEIEKGNFPHYMIKEIFEQPESIFRAMQGRIEHDNATAHLGGLNLDRHELVNIERIRIVASGTSYFAGLVASYLLEQVARIPCSAELSSELRYRNPVVERNTLYFVVSQSGETADTLFAMRELQRKGAKVLGICNVVGSTIPRESDGGVYIHSGPEIAVASTKAFTSQLSVFYLFALFLARMRHMSFHEGKNMIQAMESVPDKIREILKKAEELKLLAEKYSWARSFLYLGRGVNYPVAMEGALKLKEVSYIHAEGCSAAEIKHGPIALITEELPSVFIVPADSLREKVMSNMKEVKARKGPVIAIACEGDNEVAEIADDVFFIPQANPLVYPFLVMIPLQLLSYYMAVTLGHDVDQPRNLAKSVTVE